MLRRLTRREWAIAAAGLLIAGFAVVTGLPAHAGPTTGAITLQVRSARTVGPPPEIQKGDPITEQLVSPQLPLELIDQGKADGEIEFCGTLQELEGKLNAGLADRQPLMVHTRPMNLHVSKLTQRTGAPVLPSDTKRTG